MLLQFQSLYRRRPHPNQRAMPELHVPPQNAHVLPASVPVHQADRPGLCGGEARGPVLSDHHVPARYMSHRIAIISLLNPNFCTSIVAVELIEHQSGDPNTAIASLDRYGCSIEKRFYPEGAQIPSNPRKPCELCYCIRNKTSCVMQECTLHVDGCRPIYNKGVCCPVRYDCGKPELLYTFPHPEVDNSYTHIAYPTFRSYHR